MTLGEGELDSVRGGMVGRSGLTCSEDLGGDVAWPKSSGGGGTSGIFSDGINFSVVGVAGVKLAAETEDTGPGGAGVGPLAIWLWEPGRTTVSES